MDIIKAFTISNKEVEKREKRENILKNVVMQIIEEKRLNKKKPRLGKFIDAIRNKPKE